MENRFTLDGPPISIRGDYCPGLIEAAAGVKCGRQVVRTIRGDYCPGLIEA